MTTRKKRKPGRPRTVGKVAKRVTVNLDAADARLLARVRVQTEATSDGDAVRVAIRRAANVEPRYVRTQYRDGIAFRQVADNIGGPWRDADGPIVDDDHNRRAR